MEVWLITETAGKEEIHQKKMKDPAIDDFLFSPPFFFYFTDRSITDTVVHPLRRLFHHVDHVGGVSSRTGAGNN